MSMDEFTVWGCVAENLCGTVVDMGGPNMKYECSEDDASGGELFSIDLKDFGRKIIMEEGEDDKIIIRVVSES